MPHFQINYQPITTTEKEFLDGCLIGDGYLSNLKHGRKSPCFGIDRKLADLKYLEWQREQIISLCSNSIMYRDYFNKSTLKTYKHCILQTKYLDSLNPIRQKWYVNNIKIVPADFKLSRLIILIWYCDDGSLEFNGKSPRIKLSTNGFTPDEVNHLKNLLVDRYNEKFVLVRDSPNKPRQFAIRTHAKAAVALLSDIKELMPPGMERKFI